VKSVGNLVSNVLIHSWSFEEEMDFRGKRLKLLAFWQETVLVLIVVQMTDWLF